MTTLKGKVNPQYWAAWSGEEQRLWERREASYLRVAEAEAALLRTVEREQLVHELEEAGFVMCQVRLMLVAARLRRLRPDLADLIDHAVDVEGANYGLEPPAD